MSDEKPVSRIAADSTLEEYVLGAAFMGGGRLLEQLHGDFRLRPHHFWRLSHAAVYEAMIRLSDETDLIDPVLLAGELRAKYGRDGFEAFGGAAKLEQLAGTVPHLENWRGYAKEIIELYKIRVRQAVAYEQLDALAQHDLGRYEQAARVLDDDADELNTGLKDPFQLGSDFVDWLQAPKTTAIETPWEKITAGLYGGLRPGDVTILAGWTGMGKSTAGDQLLAHTRTQFPDFRCCVYVNEMGQIERTARLIAGRSGIYFRRLLERSATKDPAAVTKIIAAASDLPFYLQPCAGWTADEIARDIRRHKWDLWMVDHASKIPARDVADWDHVSGTLADVARITNTHGIVVVQLNQERLKSPERPVPVLRDLRNTGRWAMDARAVIFVHRREQLDPDRGVVVTYDDGTIHLAKVNNGEPAVEPVFMQYGKMRFLPLNEGV